jgi:hypothetical protein
MFKWIHHLLEPHCEQCKAELEEQKVCASCEVLRHQLEIANYEKKQVLQALLDSSKPVQPEERVQVNPESLKPRAIPWMVRKQMLEAEDKEKAKVIVRNRKLQEQAKDNSVNELEKELGVS